MYKAVVVALNTEVWPVILPDAPRGSVSMGTNYCTFHWHLESIIVIVYRSAGGHCMHAVSLPSFPGSSLAFVTYFDITTDEEHLCLEHRSLVTPFLSNSNQCNLLPECILY